MYIPLDWASDVLAEYVTEDESDEEMTTMFWEWDGAESEDES